MPSCDFQPLRLMLCLLLKQCVMQTQSYGLRKEIAMQNANNFKQTLIAAFE